VKPSCAGYLGHPFRKSRTRKPLLHEEAGNPPAKREKNDVFSLFLESKQGEEDEQTQES
jgi:hypothetical protein